MKPQILRGLIESALPEAAHAEANLALGHLYLPAGHAKAISLDRPLVVGDRGAGKSFWLKSLADSHRRALIGTLFDFPTLLDCEVVTGFDPTTTGNYPDSRELSSLVSHGVLPVDVWYAVMVCASLPEVIPATASDWLSRVTWVQNHASAVSSDLKKKNAALATQGKRRLIAFDGLDRVANNWRQTVNLVRGLLQAQLEFRKYTHICTKAFIRPDMLADNEVRRFPDASKLVSLAVKLEWEPIDLYGLLWQYLANSPDSAGSDAFRAFSAQRASFDWQSGDDGIFVLTDATRNSENSQEALFHLIAGKTMGRGAKSGNPWKWLPSHLSDANGYTSPRSFLVAVRSAAVDSKRRSFVGTELALHPSSVKEGVSKASEVRRNELEEDLPWITDILGPLKGLALPSRRQDVVARWRNKGTLEKLLSEQVLLPDTIVENDPGSILQALQKMGLCRVLSDGRVDFPDIVRVDAGMTRKGGIPVR